MITRLEQGVHTGKYALLRAGEQHHIFLTHV